MNKNNVSAVWSTSDERKPTTLYLRLSFSRLLPQDDESKTFAGVAFLYLHIEQFSAMNK